MLNKKIEKSLINFSLKRNQILWNSYSMYKLNDSMYHFPFRDYTATQYLFRKNNFLESRTSRKNKLSIIFETAKENNALY